MPTHCAHDLAALNGMIWVRLMNLKYICKKRWHASTVAHTHTHTVSYLFFEKLESKKFEYGRGKNARVNDHENEGEDEEDDRTDKTKKLTHEIFSDFSYMIFLLPTLATRTIRQTGKIYRQKYFHSSPLLEIFQYTRRWVFENEIPFTIFSFPFDFSIIFM